MCGIETDGELGPFIKSNEPLIKCEFKCIVTYIKKYLVGVPVVAQQLASMTSIHEDAGLIPGLAHWVEDLVLL